MEASCKNINGTAYPLTPFSQRSSVGIQTNRSETSHYLIQRVASKIGNLSRPYFERSVKPAFSKMAVAVGVFKYSRNRFAPSPLEVEVAAKL
jgi:hypothetical protein